MKESERIQQVYRKRAKNYDFATLFYNLIGFRINRYREPLVDSLNLEKGNLVIDLCCGTGLNFPLVMEKIGPSGRLIGVDFSEEMLERAHEKVIGEKWENVSLIHSDVAKYEFTGGVDAILTSYGITLVPEYKTAIENGSGSLKDGGRFGVLDFKVPESWPMPLTKIAAKTLVGPYAGTLEMAQSRDPRKVIRDNLEEVVYQEFYFGGTFLSVGERSK